MGISRQKQISRSLFPSYTYNQHTNSLIITCGTLLVDEKFELDMNLTKVEDLEGTIGMSNYNEPNSTHLIDSNGILKTS